jgi:hypothetical protein
MNESDQIVARVKYFPIADLRMHPRLSPTSVTPQTHSTRIIVHRIQVNIQRQLPLYSTMTPRIDPGKGTMNRQLSSSVYASGGNSIHVFVLVSFRKRKNLKVVRLFTYVSRSTKGTKNESAPIEDLFSSLTSVITQTVKESKSPCVASNHIFYKIYRFLTLPNIRERCRNQCRNLTCLVILRSSHECEWL